MNVSNTHHSSAQPKPIPVFRADRLGSFKQFLNLIWFIAPRPEGGTCTGPLMGVYIPHSQPRAAHQPVDHQISGRCCGRCGPSQMGL